MEHFSAGRLFCVKKYLLSGGNGRFVIFNDQGKGFDPADGVAIGIAINFPAIVVIQLRNRCDLG